MGKRICDYCGEFPGSIKRPSPNIDDNEMWNVCPTCDKLLKQQMKVILGQILTNYINSDGNKIIKEATTEIEKLAHEAGLDVQCVKIQLND